MKIKTLKSFRWAMIGCRPVEIRAFEAYKIYDVDAINGSDMIRVVKSSGRACPG